MKIQMLILDMPDDYVPAKNITHQKPTIHNPKKYILADKKQSTAIRVQFFIRHNSITSSI